MTAMAVFLRNQMRIIAPFATLIVLVAFFSLTSRSFASTLALPPTQLAYAYQMAGDEPGMVRNLELAFELSPNPALASALSQVRMRPLLPPADSP